MNIRTYLSDENGTVKACIVLYMDDSSQVIESGEIETWADLHTMSQSELKTWIKALGGEQKIAQRALNELNHADACETYKRQRDRGLETA